MRVGSSLFCSATFLFIQWFYVRWSQDESSILQSSRVGSFQNSKFVGSGSSFCCTTEWGFYIIGRVLDVLFGRWRCFDTLPATVSIAVPLHKQGVTLPKSRLVYFTQPDTQFGFPLLAGMQGSKLGSIVALAFVGFYHLLPALSQIKVVMFP